MSRENRIPEPGVEDLKNVKYRSRGRLSKKFNDRLQRRTYPKILEKPERKCAEAGVRMLRINPACTSQICHKCGLKDKTARDGEIYRCKNPSCVNYSVKTDADHNAAVNILYKGPAVTGPRRYIRHGRSYIKITDTQKGQESSENPLPILNCRYFPASYSPQVFTNFLYSCNIFLYLK